MQLAPPFRTRRRFLFPPRGLRRPPPRPPPSQETRLLSPRPHPLPCTGNRRAPRRQRGAPAAPRAGSAAVGADGRAGAAAPRRGEMKRPGPPPRPRSPPRRRVLEGFNPCRVLRGRARLAFIMYFFPASPGIHARLPLELARRAGSARRAGIWARAPGWVVTRNPSTSLLRGHVNVLT